jgi:hypothetical protein
LNRRRFLKLSAAAAAGAAVAGPFFSGRRSLAAPFGELPAGVGQVLLPTERRAKNVLEVFLYGGLSAWETLYMVENYGRPDDPDFPDQQYYSFLGGGSDSVETALSACSFPSQEPHGQFFGTDALGEDVLLGPFAHRLRQRNDLVDRMRIVVQQHKLEPHEAAVPQALTGQPLGRPNAAGLGSHIQRYSTERAGPERAAPHSYIFAVGGIAGDNVSAAAATGYHPGVARPLSINITNVDGFADLLARDQVGNARAGYDALMDIYIEQHRERLRWPGRDEIVRSASVTDMAYAVASVKNVDAISGVMDPQLFDDRPGQACGAERSFDIPGMSLQAARHLLTHPTEPARYVCVSDVGLFEASGGGGYDCHSRNSRDTSRNFDNMLRSLTEIINAPGENDSTKINLDDTLIILNTEFGRTAYPQSGGSGRNHHPYGYVTAFLGGPITSAEKGVYGAIGPNSLAAPANAATPAENRIGALLALGIWPFEQEAFAVSNVSNAFTEESAALLATEKILGITL